MRATRNHGGAIKKAPRRNLKNHTKTSTILPISCIQ